MDAPRTLLFDTASLYFRAFFGLPDSLRAKSGDPVNAVRGLLDFLARFITDYSPTHVACCWDDAWRPAWRVDLVPSYKAHRVAYGDVEEVPAALTAQVPWIRATLDALGLPIVGAADHEADDVIATLATRSTWPVDVVTGDRDLFQLVDDDRAVRVLYVGRGVAKHEQITDAWLQAKYTITGAGYVDFAVMRGDPSDGLPGVKGIGEKTAAQLIGKYGDLDGIVANAANLSSGVQRSLAAAVDYLGPAREVVTAARGVPLPEVDLALPAAPKDPELFAALTEELNLGGSADRILAALAAAGGRVS
ncbi:5'-3' exonuclease [Propioniciclava sp. MC1595]|uniref:5'-3' exonuclease n=1 Tax=Propioniciclava sp. MC1595 TaxID=2760308 RepID=UPI00166226CD|nr:5'-3' exonuclease [Propioniciclava sp. MC1595]MBB1495868.1 5'-3' exonuclease [Propioniciclava sp. MC1595]NLE17248.1 5'-3' exonuclease [Propioniciclava sp.]QTE24586.1 5'-3' exonuclease [Propioniciclava sp. MC1595]